MFQNLKVDIIYYKTNTDFEMEFNLCGCCRMRLLTDKSPDRKTALHSLARAVSRSRIIIVTGGLFGEEGIINLVSSAIGVPLAELDKGKYGLSGEEKIEILKGATPLVTADGYFGGCIIESGPQTMILISENKNVRKNIMQTLIHPYVEELCAVELKEKAAAVTDAQNTLENKEEVLQTAENDVVSQEENTLDEEVSEETQEADIKPTEETTAQEDSIVKIEDEALYIDMSQKVDIDINKGDAEAEAILSSGMIFDSDDNINISQISNEVDEPFFIDTEKVDLFSESRIKPDEESAKEFLFDEDDSYMIKPHGSVSLNVFIMILVIFLLVVLAILCYCIFYVPSRSGVSASEYIRETFNILFNKG